MHSKFSPRNRLAKPLPDAWRDYFISQGVPKRKYVAVCRITLPGERIIEELIVEQGWIVALSKATMNSREDQRIDFDPRQILKLEIIQVA